MDGMQYACYLFVSLFTFSYRMYLTPPSLLMMMNANDDNDDNDAVFSLPHPPFFLYGIHMQTNQKRKRKEEKKKKTLRAGSENHPSRPYSCSLPPTVVYHTPIII